MQQKSQLEGMGLKVKVTNEFSDTVEENKVIKDISGKRKER